MAIALTDFLPLLPLVPVLIWLYFRFLDTYFKVWEKRGIVAMPGTFPFGSSMAYTREVIFQGHIQQKMYNEFSKYPYFGFYYGSQPHIMLRDVEYVKFVMVKAFNNFRDREGLNIAEDDHLGHHLFSAEGDLWRALRVKMSPAFTSGKMKNMFPLFIKCTKDLDALLLKKVDKEVEIKEITARFSTDVITSCAFGWEVRSLVNTDDFMRKLGKEMAEFKLTKMGQLKVALMKYIPAFHEATFPMFIKREFQTYLMKAVKETIEERERTGAKRNDFIDLLIQMKKAGNLAEERIEVDEELQKDLKPIELNDALTASQVLLFFVAGFETSSSVKTFCLYELAGNQDIQDRLHREIEEVIAKNGGELTYNAVKEMEYLDMVVHETMRKYPTLTSVKRRCVAPIAFPDGKMIEKGDKMLIPIWSLHRDPENFPDPLKFDPERFSKENKDNIKPFSYLPFGEGPRICLGMRFGLLQVKVGIITFLRKFRVSSTSNQELEFDPSVPDMCRPLSEIVLKLTKRKD